jgi:putative spermidine/putrescine transport system permease protein
MQGTRLRRIAIWIFGAIILLFLNAPLLLILPISLSSGSFLSYPLPGYSLQWYAKLLEPYPWIFAFKNSLLTASLTMILSVSLGTMAAYGLSLCEFRAKKYIVALILAPLAVPVVITGLAMYFFLVAAKLYGSILGLVIAHTTIAIPFVVITVTATLQGLDRNLLRAAASLGCPPVKTFFTIALPLIFPGVAAGAIFAFYTSFDDVVIALFASTPSMLTLPRQMFSGLRDQLDPSLVAVAVVMTALSVVLMILVDTLQSRSERLRRQDE